MQGLGIVLLLAGLLLRLRTTVVVLVSALATGLACGETPMHLLEVLGKSFVDNRLLSLFLLTLPAVGLCERHGLREQAADWVKRLPAARPGRLLLAYQLLRVAQGAMAMRMNGHPGLVRPLLAPMVCAAAPAADSEELKAAAAASENYGNFYGQNLSIVAPGLLMVYGVLKSQGVEVSLLSLAGYALIPVALSLGLAAWQYRRL